MKPTPGSQLVLLATYSYHAFITDRDGDTLELEAEPSPPRRDRECHPRPQVRRGSQPSPVRPFRRQRRLAGDTGYDSQPGALDVAHRSGRAGGDHQDPKAAILLLRRSAHPLGAPPDTALASALALGGPVHWRPDPIAHPAASLLSVALPDRGAGNRPTILALIHQSVEYLSHSRRTNRPARVPCCLRPPHERLLSPATGHCRPRPPHIRRVGPLSIPVMPCSSALPTPFGGFGLRKIRRNFT